MTRSLPNAPRAPLPLAASPADRHLPSLQRAAARETLDKLRALPGRPASLQPFEALLADGGEAVLAKDGRPLVGLLCNFVPEELVLAAGALPVRLDLALGSAVEAGTRALCADLCPVVRALVGARLGALPVHARTLLTVIPTACDGKKKLARLLPGQVHTLELPQRRDTPRARERWQEDIRDLVVVLERATGRPIRRTALLHAIQLCNERTALSRRLDELRRTSPPRLRALDAFLVVQASFVCPPERWVELVRTLVAELEDAPPPDGAQASQRAARDGEDAHRRLVLVGSPVLFPELTVLFALEEAGAHVVADDLCSGSQRFYNPSVIDETSLSSLVRAVAEKALCPCTCPCFVEGGSRTDRLLDLVRRSQARGVVHHTLRLCQPCELELPMLRAAVVEQGVPLLTLTSEPGSDSMAQLRNRLDAFLEMLELS